MKLCSTPGCPRAARLGWAVCNECADRLLTAPRHEPEWVRRMKAGKVPQGIEGSSGRAA